MKKIAVVGIGIGINTLTTEALEAIRDAEVLSGASRMLESMSDIYKDTPKRLYPYYLPKDTAAMIDGEEAQRFVVLVSGDVGFYSAAIGIADALTAYSVKFIPGICTVSAFFSRLKLPWQEAAFISAHGREANVVDTVRRNRLTLCLTGSNINNIGANMIRAGLGQVKAYVGENLGSHLERVYEAAAEALAQGQYPSLTVLLFINEGYSHTTPIGLPDNLFLRATGIPMTKSETRAIVMSKLNLNPCSVCYDIGAGTGSVTMEMALSAYCGHVYAIEREEKAISLIERNCRSFHIGNVTAICGEAPYILNTLPAPDVVFIGGSGGELGNIITTVFGKKPNARIVLTAVTPETASLALSLYGNMGLDPEIIQINIARGKRVGGLHLMEAQNPITIISVGG